MPGSALSESETPRPARPTNGGRPSPGPAERLGRRGGAKRRRRPVQAGRKGSLRNRGQSIQVARRRGGSTKGRPIRGARRLGSCPTAAVASGNAIPQFSPRDFLRARRPSSFSDSSVETRPRLVGAFLEYFTSKLTSRSQESDFETFARRLCEREVCPNLLPHTGPTGGGDSKVDSETYPVNLDIDAAWDVVEDRAAATER